MSVVAPHLVVSDLEAGYGEAKALFDVSLKIDVGEFVSVLGANGAGKTTLIRCIAGMVRPTAGTVEFDGHRIDGLVSADICELGIGQIAEARQIFPTMTVFENLDLGGALKRSRRRKRDNLARVYEMFPRLAERRDQKAGTLSGGEQQMLAIGRCLMAEPSLIMLDEPSLGLSPILTEEMFETVKGLSREGITILLVEQNVADSLELCDRAYVLENGVIAMEGTGAALLADDRIRRAYLGL
jgi:branched-chain amino acid transport system ATP-binding protein